MSDGFPTYISLCLLCFKYIGADLFDRTYKMLRKVKSIRSSHVSQLSSPDGNQFTRFMKLTCVSSFITHFQNFEKEKKWKKEQKISKPVKTNVTRWLDRDFFYVFYCDSFSFLSIISWIIVMIYLMNVDRGYATLRYPVRKTK